MPQAVLSKLPSATTASVEGNFNVPGFSANWFGIFVDGCFFPFSGKLYYHDGFSSTPYEVYLFLWTNGYSSDDKAVCYSIHRKNYKAAEGGGFIADDMTYGKCVRCVQDWN